jgi:acetoin utilization protein AcuB
MRRLNAPVEEFTTPDPITAYEDTDLDTLSKIMKENEIRHVPIVRGREVVGIVSERDLRLVSGLDLREKSLVRASDIMARDPVAVDANTPLAEVAFEMSKRKIGSVIVNEGSQFMGIFTATDALNALIELSR